MIKTLTLSFPNSILFVMDFESGEPPKEMGEGLISCTGSCIAVGTRYESDGDISVLVEVGFSDKVKEMGLGRIFSGKISAPRHLLEICTILAPVLRVDVGAMTVDVDIWSDDFSEPGIIYIVIK